MKQKKRKWPLFIALIFFLTIAFGCATTGNFARLSHDYQTGRLFESYKVPAGYHYYFYGSEALPRAFVGISRDLAMDTTFWEPVDLTAGKVRNWIRRSQDEYPAMSKINGSRIIGPNGESIGVWYSLEGWQQWARIRLVDGKTVKIGMPIMNDIKVYRFRDPID